MKLKMPIKLKNSWFIITLALSIATSCNIHTSVQNMMLSTYENKRLESKFAPVLYPKKNKSLTPLHNGNMKGRKTLESLPLFHSNLVTPYLAPSGGYVPEDQMSHPHSSYLLGQLGEASAIVGSAAGLSSFFQPITPTPIGAMRHINIVKEIKLDSASDVDYDLASVEFLKQIFKPNLANDYSKRGTEPDTHMSFSRSGESFASNHDKPNVVKKNGRHLSHYNDERWDERFQELLEYRKQHGNVLVPHDYTLNKPLGQWVKRQRYQASLLCEGKRSTLTDARMRALTGIGFVWSKHSAVWEEKFLELEEFCRRFGHCNVPSKYLKNKPLSIWVRCQRRNFRQSAIPNDRCERLRAMGFDFNPRNL